MVGQVLVVQVTFLEQVIVPQLVLLKEIQEVDQQDVEQVQEAEVPVELEVQGEHL